MPDPYSNGGWDSILPHEWWRKLWKLEIQSKLAIFVWRVCYNCLPTMNALRKRNITVLNVCPICKCKTEFVEHALFSCHRSTKIQTTIFQSVWRDSFKRHTCLDIWLESCDYLIEDQLTRVCLVTWAILNDRDKTNPRQLIPLIESIYEWIVDYESKISSQHLNSGVAILAKSLPVNCLGKDATIIHVDATCKVGYNCVG